MRHRAIRPEPLFFELNPSRVRRQGYGLPALDVPPVEPSDVLPPELLRTPDPHVPDNPDHRELFHEISTEGPKTETRAHVEEVLRSEEMLPE